MLILPHFLFVRNGLYQNFEYKSQGYGFVTSMLLARDKLRYIANVPTEDWYWPPEQNQLYFALFKATLPCLTILCCRALAFDISQI